MSYRQPREAPPKASKFEVDSAAVGEEVRFYNEADTVYDHLEKCKRDIERENREFDLLLDYFTRNRGHIDLTYRSSTRLGDAAQRANLGSGDPSWYYLDERGNHIWVRNITLDSAKAASFGGVGTNATGAFEETEQADGRHVVVRVPPPKRHHSHAADYRRKCVDAEAEWATRYGDSIHGARLRGTLGAAASTGWSSTAHVRNLHSSSRPLGASLIAASLAAQSSIQYAGSSACDTASASSAATSSGAHRICSHAQSVP